MSAIAENDAAAFRHALEGVTTDPGVKVGRLGGGPVRKTLDYVVLVVVAALFVAPIAYMVIGSFKPSAEVLDGMAGFIPKDLSLDNYRGVFERFDSPSTGYFANFYLTSIIVSIAIVGGGLVVNSLAGYALARLQWRGRNLILAIVVLIVILPFEAIAVPLFYLMNDYRNTYYVQFIPFIANAFSIYLFYTFFIGIPKQIQEAARIDGAGPWKTFLLIIVPMSRPVFASVTILTFLAAWSSFPTTTAGDLGIQGRAAHRLGPDLRLRRAAGPARRHRLPPLPAMVCPERRFVRSQGLTGVRHVHDQVRQHAQGLPRRHRGHSGI
jgi:multiple sugar transport system permease protein